MNSNITHCYWTDQQTSHEAISVETECDNSD